MWNKYKWIEFLKKDNKYIVEKVIIKNKNNDINFKKFDFKKYIKQLLKLYIWDKLITQIQ